MKNMRNIFFGKAYKKCGGEASPRPVYKISKLSISMDCFIVFLCSSQDLPKYIKIKVLTLAFSLYKAFLKNKKRSGTSSP